MLRPGADNGHHLEFLITGPGPAVLSAAWAGHGPGQGASRIYIREILMNIEKHFVQN